MSAVEEARAVVEGRFLSMRAHARELSVGQPSRILATGGGSKNPEVVLGSALQCSVFVFDCLFCCFYASLGLVYLM